MAKLSDYVAQQAGVPEAPTDGFIYGRRGQDASWQVVPTKAQADLDYAPIVHTHPYVGLTGNETVNGEKVFNDKMGIGVAVNASYGLSVAGSLNLSAGSNFYVNGVQIETFIDAPSDGNVYGRSNGGWVLVSADGGTITNLSSGYFTNYVTIENSGGQDTNINAATTLLAGLMSSADKVKLNAAIEGADLSKVVTSTNNTINNTGGTGVVLNAATGANAGLMTAADKNTLDGLGGGGTLDADTLQGVAASEFLRSNVADTKSSGNLRFNDNVRCTFGNSDDSEMYHSSSTSYWNLAVATSCRIRDNGSDRFIFDDGGDFTADGDVTAFSDRRLKENIYSIPFALDKVRNLRGVYYNRIDRENDKGHIGLIAQEVMPVFPEIVRYDEPNDVYSLNYSVLVAVLIEAVKELEEKVNDLANER